MSAAAPLGSDQRLWQSLADQAEESLARGQFPAAEGLARQAVDEAGHVFPADHPNIAASLSILGGTLFRQGRFAEAERSFREALEIYERRSGDNALNTASALNNLALVLERQGDYAGAELLLRRAYRILERSVGVRNADTATTLSNLGRVLNSQGKFGAGAELIAGGAVQGVDAAQGETLEERVVSIYEATLGAEHPLTATGWSNLGNVRYLQGKFAEAETAHRRALTIREKVLGPGHPDTATSLNNLANVLFEQGKDQRSSGAEQRARASSGERVQAVSEVEGLYRRALQSQERALGADHPALANTLNNLAALLDQGGKFGESEPLQRRALSIQEKALGPLHPDTASTLTTLAVSLDRQGKIVESEQAYLRAVDTSRKAGNPRTLLLNTSRLGFALAKRGRYREALPYYREAIDTLDQLYSRTRGLSEETRQAFLGQYSNIYLETIRLMLQLHRTNPAGGYDRQILEVASRNQSRVFTELMRISDVARFSSDSAFTVLRDRRDALHGRLDGLRQTLVTLSPRQVNYEGRRSELSGQFEGATRELKLIEDQLLARYPRFMELTNPKPVTVDDLQRRLLRPGEALLTFVLLPNDTIVFAITQDRLKMAFSNVKRDDIARRVLAVRRSIDKVTSGESVLFLREINPGVLHSLYHDIVEPVADVLAGHEKLIVVGDGPLHTIPLEFLVTQWTQQDQARFRTVRSNSEGDRERPFLAEYAIPQYLGHRFRMAYLPSLSALTSQRLYPKAQSGERPNSLIAFADPEFSPDGSARKQFSQATRDTIDSLGSSVPRTRDGRPVIPRLRETAEEAREIAQVLGGKSELYIGQEAQEHMAKIGDLRSARFVLFATHGFLGGEFLSGGEADPAAGGLQKAVQRRQAQPALALSLVGDLKGEDGFLTMREVIEDLELDADLVALSACNTAGETEQANNGEGFAGLTRAFMYAGARSLVVSHWSVDSLSTQALMTRMFRNITAGQDPLSAMSESQRAMQEGVYEAGNFFFSRANPFFWAPFVYVGD